jgi:hypothetical protein
MSRYVRFGPAPTVELRIELGGLNRDGRMGCCVRAIAGFNGGTARFITSGTIRCLINDTIHERVRTYSFDYWDSGHWQSPIPIRAANLREHRPTSVGPLGGLCPMGSEECQNASV